LSRELRANIVKLAAGTVLEGWPALVPAQLGFNIDVVC
jgi:hypothetical protein